MQNPRKLEGTHLGACAAVARTVRERWLRQYVGQKLRSDPIFPTAFDLFTERPGPLLDVGCGVGLLPLYLRERGYEGAVLGIDLDERKINRAREIAATGGHHDLLFRTEDVRNYAPQFSGHVAVFDVLHYLPHEVQFDLLTKLSACVAPGAMLVIRDAPRDFRPRFWLTYLAELFAQAISWNVGAFLHFPSRAGLAAAFADQDFSSEMRPLWGRTPFNNHIFIFRRRATAADRRAG